MFKISLSNIQSLFAEINKNAKLYMPVDDTDGSAKYSQWTEGTEWSNALTTAKSPKDFFFPQMEDMMKFKTEGKNIEIIDARQECEDFVVFGVRACDARSFDILDRVFLVDPVDSYYAERRAHGVIITVACGKTIAEPTLADVGTSPSKKICGFSKSYTLKGTVELTVLPLASVAVYIIL